MRASKFLVGAALLLMQPGFRPVLADVVSDIVNQATLTEYRSYLRVLTGVDTVGGDPPIYLATRYASSADARRAGDWLTDRFTGWGCNVTQQMFSTRYSPNIIAERLGTTRPQDIYIISAHYDCYNSANSNLAPGCDDNGSGTAAVLTAARILSQYNFDATVRFVAFSAEEQGLVGSDAYAHQSQSLHENIRGVINLDMILHPAFDNHPANSDYDLDLSSNPASLPLTQLVADQFARYTSIPIQIHGNAVTGSDEYSFWQHGFSALEVAENTPDEVWGGSNATYHTANDVLTHPDFDWPFALDTVRGSMAGLIGLAGLTGLTPEPGMMSGFLLLALLTTCRALRPAQCGTVPRS